MGLDMQADLWGLTRGKNFGCNFFRRKYLLLHENVCLNFFPAQTPTFLPYGTQQYIPIVSKRLSSKTLPICMRDIL